MALYGFDGSYAIPIPTELRYAVLGRPPVRYHSHISNRLALLALADNIHILQLAPNAAHALQLLDIGIYPRCYISWTSMKLGEGY